MNDISLDMALFHRNGFEIQPYDKKKSLPTGKCTSQLLESALLLYENYSKVEKKSHQFSFSCRTNLFMTSLLVLSLLYTVFWE
jgi:hypothetical protein